MKKIVALGAIAALLSGMIFADEPAIDIKVAELSGHTEVKWGFDLDAGQHGFSHDEGADLKVNLWNEGTKETSGDDIWADIQVKGKGLALKNKGWDGDGNASVERAKIHIGDFYVDIRSGDTTVGEYKPNMAIHSDKWSVLGNVGIDFKNGIQVGYDAEAFKFALDFRSYAAANTNLTSAYGIEFGAELKDNLVPGLTASAGIAYNLSADYKSTGSDKVDGYNDKGTQADLDSHVANIIDWDKGIALTNNLVSVDLSAMGGSATQALKDGHQLGYGVKAAYKLGIGDDMYVTPSLGYRGTYTSGTIFGDPYGIGKDKTASVLAHDLGFGVMFGWGKENDDSSAGVPYIGDEAKKKCEGVSVVAFIPLPTVTTYDDHKHTEHNALQALIVPGFYLGESKVEGLKAAAYGEIGIYKFIKDEDQPEASSDGKITEHFGSVKENETSAIAFAAGVAYGIAVDEITVTPKAGFRYANGAYVSNKTKDYVKSTVFDNDLGFQKAPWDADKAAKQAFDGDFFNLTIGVDVGGLINNTTFSAEYKSANIMNNIVKRKVLQLTKQIQSTTT